MFELVTVFLHTTAIAMVWTSCMTLMPVLCLQAQAPLCLSWYTTSDDDDVPSDISQAKKVSHHACASAGSSALRSSCLICSLHSLAWRHSLVREVGNAFLHIMTSTML